MTKQAIIDFMENTMLPQYVGDTFAEADRSFFRKCLGTIDCYEIWYKHFYIHDNKWSYHKIDDHFTKNAKSIFWLYAPTFTEECGQRGEVEINVVNKRLEKTGKRTHVKVGRFLGQAFPFMSDRQKETITTWVKDKYTPVDLDFTVASEGFEAIITMTQAKRSEFDTTRHHKQINNSCMRYTRKELGLETYHPYEAYESGDFKLAYIHKDNKLYGRVILHPDSMTNSAIYGVSKKATEYLRQKVRELGYTFVDDDGNAWEGAKLKYLEDYALTPEEMEDDPDSTDFEMHVCMAPYVDFWDHTYGYVRDGYIWLTSDDTSGKTIDMQCAEGFNEL